MSTISTILTAIFAGIAVALLLAVIIATPLWLLWNWLMPVVFGLKVITWWQALGLAWLSGILFKSSSTSTK